jgi:hypothetical protein
MRPQLAGTQVQRSVLDVQHPGMAVKLLGSHRDTWLTFGQFDHIHNPVM